MQNESQTDCSESDNNAKAVDGSQTISVSASESSEKRQLLPAIPQSFMPDLSGSEDDEVSEVIEALINKNI